MFTATVKHAQICGEIFKCFYSAKSLNQPPEALARQRENMETKLEEWRDSLPKRLTLHPNLISQVGDSFKDRANICRLNRTYYGSILALHATFHYPWIWSRFSGQSSTQNAAMGLQDLASESSSRAAIAARQILSSLKDCAPDLSSTSP
jgi:hypothetical protein